MMDAFRRLTAWSADEFRGRAHGLQVFASVGGGFAIHLTEALRKAERRSKPGRPPSVKIPRGLAQELLDWLGAIAAETPSPYVVAFEAAGGWRAEMRLAVQNGRLIVSDLHVTPEQRDHIPGGGITARALRRVPLHAGIVEFAGMLHPLRREQLETMLVGTGLDEMLCVQLGARNTMTAKRTGRRPLQTDTLLAAASAYAKAIAAGSARPVEDAATALDMKMVRVRDLVHKARLRGLLTPAKWGQPGGELTPPAKALLKKQRRNNAAAASRPRRPRR